MLSAVTKSESSSDLVGMHVQTPATQSPHCFFSEAALGREVTSIFVRSRFLQHLLVGWLVNGSPIKLLFVF